MKPILLIGEAPSRTSDPSLPFHGDPVGCFARYVGRHVFEDVQMEAVNLLNRWPGYDEGGGSRFPEEEARQKVKHLTLDGSKFSFFLLAGTRVARAFDVQTAYFKPVSIKFECAIQSDSGGTVNFYPSERFATVVPHPSGINRYWNEPENLCEALRFFARLQSVCRRISMREAA